MEYTTYVWIYTGFAFAIFLFAFCIFLLFPHRLLAQAADKLFGIRRLDFQNFVMNFYGIHIDYLSSRRFRLSLIYQLVIALWIILLLIIDGLIIQVQTLDKYDYCPRLDSTCFKIGKFSKHEKIPCQQNLLLSNLTSSNVACWVWVCTEQTAVDMLNQLGICSSVFTLICLTFRYSCWMSRKWWGLILLILLFIASITALIIFMALELPISMGGKLLLLAFIFLLINVIQLFQFTYKQRCTTSESVTP